MTNPQLYEREQKIKDNSSVSLDIYGLEVKCKFEGEDLQKVRTLMEMLEVKKRFRENTGGKEVYTPDALMTITAVGLGEKVTTEFNKLVWKRKKESLLGIASCLGLCALSNYYDFPAAVEIGSYVVAVAGGIASVLNYARTHLAEMYISNYLK